MPKNYTTHSGSNTMDLSGTESTRGLEIARLQFPCFRKTRQASPSNDGLHVGCGPTSRVSRRVVAYEVGRVVAALSPATLTCNLTSIFIKLDSICLPTSTKFAFVTKGPGLHTQTSNLSEKYTASLCDTKPRSLK
jgi:hypothetical protein